MRENISFVPKSYEFNHILEIIFRGDLRMISGRFYARKVKHFQDALGVANTTAEECMSNVRTIRSFACDDKACEKYNADIDNSLKIGRMLSFIYGSFQGAVSLLVQVSLDIDIILSFLLDQYNSD